MKKMKVGDNITIEWRGSLKQQVRENFSNRQWADLTQRIIEDKIKKLIDKGLSPVAGERMFQKYKDPKKYPGDLKSPNKPNLRLSGDMLSNYQARATNDPMTITLGIHSDAPELERIKAKANNEGTETSASQAARKYLAMARRRGSTENRMSRSRKEALRAQFAGIVARRFVPLKGETYTRQILLEIRKAFAYCLKQALDKGRKNR